MCNENFVARIKLEEHNKQTHGSIFGQNVEDSNENDEPTSGSDYSQDSFEDFADLFGNDGADVDSNEDYSHIKVQYVPF